MNSNLFGDNISGDKIINNNYHLIESGCELIEINEDYFQDNKVKPELTRLIEILKENKIIFISGGLTDKKKIARLLALKLKEIKNKEGFSSFEIFDSGGGAIADYIYRNNDSGCFVLQGMDTGNLATFYNDFDSLKEKDLFLIITTDEPKALWNLSFRLRNTWQEFDDQDIYSKEQIKLYILSEIRLLKESESLIIEEDLEKIILEKTSNLKSLIKQKQFLQEVARKSKTSDIRNNLEFLDSLLIKINDDAQGFQLWFDFSLNDEDRMLVIGLSAFYGMSAEQTFSILDRLVDEVWRPRRAGLSYYDYKDVQKISTHFEVVGHNIELKNDYFPNVVFKHCWEKYRRLLTTLLPIAIKIAKESFDANKKTNRELFGTKIKKQKLRSSVSLFLGRIALLDFNVVEEYIVDLITFKNDGAVSIAARAISDAYHDSDDDFKKKIDLLITSWLDKNNRVYKNTINLLKEELKDRKDDETIPESRLQILVAYILMYILNQYISNNAPQNLKQLLLNLIDNSSPEVRNKLAATVLQSVYTTHFDQFSDEIDKFICKYGMQDSFALIMANNFKRHQNSILNLLNSWFTNPTDKVNQDAITDNKKLMLVGLKTLRKIHDLGIFPNIPDKEKIIHGLNRIIANEKNEEIKSSAFDILIDAAIENSITFDKELQNSITFLNEEDRKLLINVISKKYLIQRKSLTGGDVKAKIGGESYELWLDHRQYPRPRLPIEKMMDKWLQEALTKESAQLAYLAQFDFINFFEREEETVINDIIEKRKLYNYEPEEPSFDLQKIIETSTNDFKKSSPADLFSLSILYAEIVSIPLSIRKKYPEEEKVIRAILPVILKQKQEERNDIVYRLSINERWELAESIKIIIQLDQNKFFVIMIIIILFLALLKIVL